MCRELLVAPSPLSSSGTSKVPGTQIRRLIGTGPRLPWSCWQSLAVVLQVRLPSPANIPPWAGLAASERALCVWAARTKPQQTFTPYLIPFNTGSLDRSKPSEIPCPYTSCPSYFIQCFVFTNTQCFLDAKLLEAPLFISSLAACRGTY